jgi:hypothetical protein
MWVQCESKSRVTTCPGQQVRLSRGGTIRHRLTYCKGSLDVLGVTFLRSRSYSATHVLVAEFTRIPGYPQRNSGEFRYEYMQSSSILVRATRKYMFSSAHK